MEWWSIGVMEKKPPNRINTLNAKFSIYNEYSVLYLPLTTYSLSPPASPG
jgi:hypothetical protein